MPDAEIRNMPSSRPEDVAAADRMLQKRAMVISGHQYQPKIVYTLVPWPRDELQRMIEANGSAPFVLLDSLIELPRSCLKWAGAPYWAQYAYLVNVEVKATFGPNEK